MNRHAITLLSFALVTAALLSSGCAATRQAKDVKPSGFLSEERSLLHEGEQGKEARMVYRNPKTNWASYNKVLLEPVTIWQRPDEKLTADEQRDLQHLADSFYDMLYVKLSKHYEMVGKPTPGAIRVQAAITHGEQAYTALTFVSKVVPQLRLANVLWRFSSGKPAFAGEVTLEFKVHDSQTGELLAAGADRRVGGVNLFDKEVFNSWGDVKNSLDFWVDASVYRFCQLRGETNCEKPKA
jgi:hypothetical protein